MGKGKDRRLQIESRKTANWSARQNGLDMAFKIRGLYVREQENKGPEFSVVMIDASNRPDWAAMRRTQPKIEVPGLNVPPRGRPGIRTTDAPLWSRVCVRDPAIMASKTVKALASVATAPAAL